MTEKIEDISEPTEATGDTEITAAEVTPSEDNAASEPTSPAFDTSDTAAGSSGEAPDTETQINTASDISALCLQFPELRAGDVRAAVDNKRYKELRELGLAPGEAFLATAKAPHTDNRSHLVGGVPSGARVHSAGMTSWEMSTARGLFSDLTESEIKRLFNKVVSQSSKN